jgi:dTDP-4-amino-4,6-dideoxygalactose transaminase
MPLRVPFSPPRIDEESIAAVSAVLRSGWITTGPQTRAFEQALTAYTKVQETVCVNSASAGLELALRWYGVGPGDEVIVPAYTYAASANVVLHCGAKVVFVDSREDFNLDPEKVRQAITPATKVIMSVDIGGWPCDYDALYAVVEDSEIRRLFQPKTEAQEKLGRILLLADAAHSLGASYKGKITGSLADITIFSFHAVKNLTTAEGGAICLQLPPAFDANEIARTLRIKSLHGQSRDALSKMNSPQWRYDIIEPGYKCNMTDIQAALGLVELARYEDSHLPHRKKIMEKYDAAFGQDARFELPLWQNNESHSSYHLYMLRLNKATEAQRDTIIQSIFEEEVAVNVHFVPLPLMSLYQKMDYKIEDYPLAWCNFRREISLPVYFDLTEEMQGLVIESVRKAVDKHLPAE